MTIGSTATGVITPVTTSQGAGFVRVNQESKTWNGGDRPNVRPTYVPYSVLRSVERLRVRKGQSYVTIKYYQKHLKYRVKPPKRANTEPVNAYVSSYQRLNDRVVEYTQPGFNGAWLSFTGQQNNISTLVGYSPSWDSNDDIALLGKLREAVAGSDFNAGVFLGEGKEALSMITSAASRIYRAYSATRKGDLVRARRFLVSGTDRSQLGRKVVANNWLELQYGWLPLLKDVHAGAEFLANQFSVPLTKKYTARSSRKTVQFAGDNPGFAIWSSQKAYSRGQIIAVLKEKDVVALSGLTDPASVAWELLPYSFVLDWFIPVGNYLSARGLAQSLTGTFVTSIKHLIDCQGCKAPAGSVRSFRGPMNELSAKKVSFTRTISTSLSVPMPRAKGLAEVVSWKRAANAVALLSQLKR